MSDQIVMTISGAGAKSAQTLDVPFPRPRQRDKIDEHPDYHTLKAEMVRHLSRETRAVEESRLKSAVT